MVFLPVKKVGSLACPDLGERFWELQMSCSSLASLPTIKNVEEYDKFCHHKDVPNQPAEVMPILYRSC